MPNDDDNFLNKQKHQHIEILKQRSLKKHLQTLCQLVRKVDEALEQVDSLKYYFEEDKIDWVEEAYSICDILKGFCDASPEFIQYKKDENSDEYSFDEAINEGLSDLEIIFIDFTNDLYLTDPILENHINDIENEICTIENLEEEHLTEYENLNKTKHIVEMVVDEYKGACKDAIGALEILYETLSKDPYLQ